MINLGCDRVYHTLSRVYHTLVKVDHTLRFLALLARLRRLVLIMIVWK
jgi:hypothetical protein